MPIFQFDNDEGSEVEGEIKKLFEKFKANGGIPVETVVVKRIPAKKEWTKMHQELIKMKDEYLRLDKAIIDTRKKFWAKVELDMDDFRTNKKFNSEKNEIEIVELRHEHEEKNKSVKSPLQMM